ncbi:Ldh family oxidoreductase [Streptomyces sp. B3I8]|uniref:Ldh family oxidoreductase n=1 Tax=Streptomyces sp. B3I8 TaxID=3042303 RepID=UPI002788FB7E|nr:Ldh family oxidoreductase [Streptomyces sp. B3I8]MDQ0791253.1 LDH2 family malate/lactate/ureidoglycolate dehydrogenase [Streptomyces sp. B3I8]
MTAHPSATTTAAPGPRPHRAPPAPGFSRGGDVRVPYEGLRDFVTGVFRTRELPADRARGAAEALCHGDLTGFTTHGVGNLARLYLPLLDSGRCDPRAEPELLADSGAAVLLDARRGLGLWTATEAMELAVGRARLHGVGLVSVRGGTHFGCAGHHALRAVDHGMIGLAASNCGRQRLAPPLGGALPMLGTNPLALAAPGGAHPPFVLDMSTTVVPTGRIRAAARAGERVPDGWLEDADGAPVGDPAAYDRGEARLRWLGGSPETGGHKGYGLGLLVEVLSALLPGAGLGPQRDASTRPGSPRPDDDVGHLLLAVAPGRLRPEEDFLDAATGLFGALLDCPPARADEPVTYPGRREWRRSRDRIAHGVPLGAAPHRELLALAERSGVAFPAPVADGTGGAA